jgi:Mrp family chromosome partitioning ATPase
MGEISDALRRAQLESEQGRAESSPKAGEPEATDTPWRPPTSGQHPEETPPVSIPSSRDGEWANRVVITDPYGGAASRFLQFAWRIRRELDARQARSLAITSSIRHEGKTFVACNLALALASISPPRERIALLDLDLRNPSIASRLGVRPRVGLDAVLLRRASTSEARVTTDFFGLDLFLGDVPVDNAHELLGGVPNVLVELTRSYRTVILDTPPVLPVRDTPIVLEHTDAAVTVGRARYTPRAALQQMLDLLPQEKILGLFVNSIRSASQPDSYLYYGAKD